MSKVIITGATGTAGSAVLTAAVQSPTITQIAVLSRRPPFESSSKIKHIQLPSSEYPQGFNEIPPQLIEELKRDGYESCIWALGISQTQVKADEYVKITHDYPLTAAKAFAGLGAANKPFKFIYMSGEGARQDEKGYQTFANVKGRTEKELYELRNDKFDIINIRPGGIMPTPEHIPRMNWWMGQSFKWFGPFANRIIPSMMINSSDLGKVCIGLAQGNKGWDQRDEEGVINNVKLRQMAQDWI